MHLVVEYRHVSVGNSAIKEICTARSQVESTFPERWHLSRNFKTVVCQPCQQEKQNLNIIVFLVSSYDLKGTCIIGCVYAGSKSGLYAEINKYLKGSLTANS